MTKLKENIEDFKKASLFKKGLISVAAISGAIALVANYKTVKEKMLELVEKVKDNEEVHAFVKEAWGIVKPFTQQIDNVIKEQDDKIAQKLTKEDERLLEEDENELADVNNIGNNK